LSRRPRRDFDPDELPGRGFYKLLNSVVIPRPIAWVSTRSPEGVDNLAPHSFFTVSCVEPPVIQFTSVGRKDSLRNAEATGEMVVNLAPGHHFEQINATATDFPPQVSEFDAVGIEREPSLRVAPPRVASSPVALECRLAGTESFGDSTVVFCRVVHAAIVEDVLDGELADPVRLDPLARLGRNQWSRLGEVLAIDRIPHARWPGHYRPGGG
jgi:flavin reductase (DIM6/NTAB) family NADH-FMN oxidoreductase RutF